MNKIDVYIKDYILYYANELKVETGESLSEEKLSSETEVKNILSFID